MGQPHKNKKEALLDRFITVSLDPNHRRTSDGIEILPSVIFLDRLWSHQVI